MQFSLQEYLNNDWELNTYNESKKSGIDLRAQSEELMLGACLAPGLLQRYKCGVIRLLSLSTGTRAGAVRPRRQA